MFAGASPPSPPPPETSSDNVVSHRSRHHAASATRARIGHSSRLLPALPHPHTSRYVTSFPSRCQMITDSSLLLPRRARRPQCSDNGQPRRHLASSAADLDDRVDLLYHHAVDPAFHDAVLWAGVLGVQVSVLVCVLCVSSFSLLSTSSTQISRKKHVLTRSSVRRPPLRVSRSSLAARVQPRRSRSPYLPSLHARSVPSTSSTSITQLTLSLSLPPLLTPPPPSLAHSQVSSPSAKHFSSPVS